MIAIGKYNTLKILRSTTVGLFLGDDEGTEILLPNKYVPPNYELGAKLEVFCYLDHQERPVATTQEPKVKRDEYAYLKVVDVTAYGAFIDWGLEKHLLVPFSEQPTRMVKGNHYIIHCYLDELSFRLVASGRLERFLKPDHQLTKGEKVNLMISRKTDLGWEVIINNKHKGLLFSSDVFEKVKIGNRLDGYVKKVRPDNKIDVVLQPEGLQMLEPLANKIFRYLKISDGFLPLHDKSPPEAIYETFQVSKKAFKKAIGSLYKQRKIEIREDGIYLL